MDLESSDLPSGKTCADCYWWKHCSWLIRLKGNETECNWIPSRFRGIEPSTAEDAAKGEATNEAQSES